MRRPPSPRLLGALVLGVLGLVAATHAEAADYARREARRDARPVREAARETVRVPVVIDDLYLHYPRCRTDRDCIAPRILPIEGGRRLVEYRAITVPADPRFVDHYAR